MLNRYRRLLMTYQPTSREAWDSVQEHLPAVDQRILGLIRARAGETCDGVRVATGLKHQTVSAQIRHMTEAGILRDSGRTGVTESGRKAIVWELNDVPNDRLF